ncbi:uncharacterized protein LOC134525734 [Chroicocephalus ridibundus]|uniref:uncharacterized protein LOC134525734 n=1 Tax=Chroicocephalus ridibundus TaxID=1192867 RepID=UPI002FDCC6D9
MTGGYWKVATEMRKNPEIGFSLPCRILKDFFAVLCGRDRRGKCRHGSGKAPGGEPGLPPYPGPPPRGHTPPPGSCSRRGVTLARPGGAPPHPRPRSAPGHGRPPGDAARQVCYQPRLLSSEAIKEVRATGSKLHEKCFGGRCYRGRGSCRASACWVQWFPSLPLSPVTKPPAPKLPDTPALGHPEQLPSDASAPRQNETSPVSGDAAGAGAGPGVCVPSALRHLPPVAKEPCLDRSGIPALPLPPPHLPLGLRHSGVRNADPANTTSLLGGFFGSFRQLGCEHGQCRRRDCRLGCDKLGVTTTG